DKYRLQALKDEIFDRMVALVMVVGIEGALTGKPMPGFRPGRQEAAAFVRAHYGALLRVASVSDLVEEHERICARLEAGERPAETDAPIQIIEIVKPPDAEARPEQPGQRGDEFLS